MMKKRILVAVLVLVIFLAAAPAFARTGLGVSAGLPLGAGLPGNNVMLSLKTDSFPLLLGLGASLGSAYTSIGITADYWILNNNLAGPLNWYIGLGGYAALGLGSTASIDLGARLPIGLNLFVLDGVLEFFVEAAPAIGVGFSDPVRFPVLGAQSAVGFRIWF